MAIECGHDGCPNDSVVIVVAPTAMEIFAYCEDHAQGYAEAAQEHFDSAVMANVAAVIVLVAREVAT